MISVVIRVKNELTTLKGLLISLQEQTYKDFEIILIDNQSSDGTRKYSSKLVDKIINITDEEFSHAASCNLGVRHAQGDCIYFTNGHSLPVSNKMLQTVDRIFKDESIAGIYGKNHLYKVASRRNLYEKWLYLLNELFFPKKYKEFSKLKPGMLQTTSACVRKSLLEEIPFRELKAGGGEDMLLAKEILNRGLKIAYSPALDVYHSHGGSNLKTFRRHMKYLWMGLEAVFSKTHPTP